jgi:hypothetical protein
MKFDKHQNKNFVLSILQTYVGLLSTKLITVLDKKFSSEQSLVKLFNRIYAQIITRIHNNK